MSAAHHAPEPAWIRLVSPALIVAAVAAAYSDAWHASFQFDDWRVIVDEPKVGSLGAWWSSLPAIRPLLKLSYALNNSLPFRLAGFHLVNIALHAGSSLLACALLRRLALRGGAAPGRARVMASMGALLFALHPVQTEAVTYISGRSTSLAAFFTLASLLAWIEARAGSASSLPAPGMRGRRSGVWLAAVSALLFALALLAKETAAVLPLAILLWESGNLRRAAARGAPPAERLKIPWAHLAILAGALALAARSAIYRYLLATSLHARGFWSNILTQASATTYLTRQLIRFDRLNADPALPVEAFLTAGLALKILLLGALLTLGLVWMRRRPAPAFGILWFFLFLAPTNSLLARLDVANDRQLYLAILGPVWLVIWTARRLPLEPLAPVALLACLALLLGLATYHRNLVYADEISFWRDVTRKSPHNGRAFNNLGYAYAVQARHADAEKAFVRALEIDPGDVRAAVNLRLLREGALMSRSSPP